MTVSEFIKHLSNLPQDATVVAANDIMGFMFEASPPVLIDAPKTPRSRAKQRPKAVLVGC